MSSESLEQAFALIDQANSEDPNTDTDAEGKEWPKELLYSMRMTDMLNRFRSDADEVHQICMRGQHIQRWKSPRSDYPMDKKGYYQWRTNLYKFHGDMTAEIMQQVGYDEASVERARAAVSKKNLKSNPDSQLLEDIADLVFIEHYMLAFAGQHGDYSEEKWINIIKKTWNKMSESAHEFALGGNIQLPEPLVPLIQKSIA